MLDVKTEGNRAIMDLRESIKGGAHPRFAVFEYVKAAPVGTVFEIHVPRRPIPLIKGLEDLGMKVVIDTIAEGHVRVVTAKLTEV